MHRHPAAGQPLGLVEGHARQPLGDQGVLLAAGLVVLDQVVAQLRPELAVAQHLRRVVHRRVVHGGHHRRRRPAKPCPARATRSRPSGSPRSSRRSSRRSPSGWRRARGRGGRSRPAARCRRRRRARRGRREGRRRPRSGRRCPGRSPRSATAGERRRPSCRRRGCRRSCCGTRPEVGQLVGVPGTGRPPGARDPDDVGPLADLLVVDRRLRTLERQWSPAPGPSPRSVAEDASVSARATHVNG